VLGFGKEIAAVLLQFGILMKTRPDAAKQIEAWLKDLMLANSRAGR
jgi:hypothetical protein